jgi:hypothetical protein
MDAKCKLEPVIEAFLGFYGLDSSSAWDLLLNSFYEIRQSPFRTMCDFVNIPKDPWCDFDNPRVVEFEQISAAAYKIRGGVVRTPCDVRNILISSQRTICCKSDGDTISCTIRK